MAASYLPTDDNQLEDKHVESVFVPRLDESSNLSISTRKNEEVVSTQPPIFFLIYRYLNCKSKLARKVEFDFGEVLLSH